MFQETVGKFGYMERTEKFLTKSNKSRKNDVGSFMSTDKIGVLRE